MTDMDIPQPQNIYAERARREGVARNVLRAVGIETTGEGLMGRHENYTETAARFAPHIQAVSIGCISLLETAGIELPDLERPTPTHTNFSALVGRRALGSIKGLVKFTHPNVHVK